MLVDTDMPLVVYYGHAQRKYYGGVYRHRQPPHLKTDTKAKPEARDFSSTDKLTEVELHDYYEGGNTY